MRFSLSPARPGPREVPSEVALSQEGAGWRAAGSGSGPRGGPGRRATVSCQRGAGALTKGVGTLNVTSSRDKPS